MCCGFSIFLFLAGKGLASSSDILRTSKHYAVDSHLSLRIMPQNLPLGIGIIQSAQIIRFMQVQIFHLEHYCKRLLSQEPERPCLP
ncbi:hypothetical protein FKM82_016424 [Ascaphus truei]